MLLKLKVTHTTRWKRNSSGHHAAEGHRRHSESSTCSSDLEKPQPKQIPEDTGRHPSKEGHAEQTAGTTKVPPPPPPSQPTPTRTVRDWNNNLVTITTKPDSHRGRCSVVRESEFFVCFIA